jgi:hypothetical protein
MSRRKLLLYSSSVLTLASALMLASPVNAAAARADSCGHGFCACSETEYSCLEMWQNNGDWGMLDGACESANHGPAIGCDDSPTNDCAPGVTAYCTE